MTDRAVYGAAQRVDGGWILAGDGGADQALDGGDAARAGLEI